MTDKTFSALGMRIGRKGKEERTKVQKVKFGEEVILTWDWNLKTDVKEQKQLPSVNPWMGEAKGGGVKVLSSLHHV